jgi:hypothetical protein
MVSHFILDILKIRARDEDLCPGDWFGGSRNEDTEE